MPNYLSHIELVLVNHPNIPAHKTAVVVKTTKPSFIENLSVSLVNLEQISFQLEGIEYLLIDKYIGVHVSIGFVEILHTGPQLNLQLRIKAVILDLCSLDKSKILALNSLTESFLIP